MGMIVCDKCGHEQRFSPHIAKMGNGVERVYIACEKCKEQYTAYYTDKLIRELQARQRKIATKISGKRTEAYLNLYTEYESNKDRLTIMMFELRRKVDNKRNKCSNTPPGSKGG